MPIEYQRKMIPRAKELRKDMTRQEKKLWYDFLCDYPVRFQRQKTISSFVADFYCFRAKLIIELDGSQHCEPKALEYDRTRTRYLQKQGFECHKLSLQMQILRLRKNLLGDFLNHLIYPPLLPFL